MCGSEELIHDARQVDLEEMIMTNETPMYLVPGRLTDEQRDKIVSIVVDCSDPETDLSGSELQAFRDMADRVVAAILSGYGPIQPCADVETVTYRVSLNDAVGFPSYVRMPPSPEDCSEHELIVDALVRRTDMEAQVTRVAAEKDAEIARMRKDERERVIAAVGEQEMKVDLGKNQAAFNLGIHTAIAAIRALTDDEGKKS